MQLPRGYVTSEPTSTRFPKYSPFPEISIPIFWARGRILKAQLSHWFFALERRWSLFYSSHHESFSGNVKSQDENRISNFLFHLKSFSISLAIHSLNYIQTKTECTSSCVSTRARVQTLAEEEDSQLGRRSSNVFHPWIVGIRPSEGRIYSSTIYNALWCRSRCFNK